MNTLFIRLLKREDKAASLSEALEAVRQGDTPDSVVHVVDPVSFQQVPGSPFAYWVSERIRRLFTELPRFEGKGRTVKQGLATADDFRFVRAWWEVSPARILDGGNGPAWQDELEVFQAWCRQRTFEGKRWVPFAKGGAYSPYYADLHLVVNWERDGEEIRSFVDPNTGRLNSRPQNTDFYFRPGLTWSDRTTSLFSSRLWPAGGIFSVKGSAGFFPGEEFLALGLMNSSLFNGFLSILVGAGDAAARSYQVGVIGAVPFPMCTNDAQDYDSLKSAALTAAEAKRSLDTTNQTSLVFRLPTLLQIMGDNLTSRIVAWQRQLNETQLTLAKFQRKIDDLVFRLYRIGSKSQRVIEDSLGRHQSTIDEEEVESETRKEEQPLEFTFDARSLIEELLDYCVSCALGRWDIHYATEQYPCPELPDPFAPLPVCSPGMLVQTDGLPAGPQDVPGDYPLRISWIGVLVDDEGHPDDLGGRVRQVFEVLWPERASEIEQEACDLLGVRSLRDYFSRPNSFFAEHLKRYSKSRRQAPIYWPLQTPSGSYTVWVYYHRLTDQTLYTCVNDVVAPKLTQLTEQLNALRTKTNRSNQEEKELELLLDFELELRDFRDELLRVAAFWRPNLNDGVQITAAPLWKLFQHKPWQKKLKDTWAKLEAGDYDWAHLAYSIWPDRVRETCKHDKSLAIAHGLDELYETPLEPRRKKRGRKQMEMG